MGIGLGLGGMEESSPGVVGHGGMASCAPRQHTKGCAGGVGCGVGCGWGMGCGWGVCGWVGEGWGVCGWGGGGGGGAVRWGIVKEESSPAHAEGLKDALHSPLSRTRPFGQNTTPSAAGSRPNDPSAPVLAASPPGGTAAQTTPEAGPAARLRYGACRWSRCRRSARCRRCRGGPAACTQWPTCKANAAEVGPWGSTVCFRTLVPAPGEGRGSAAARHAAPAGQSEAEARRMSSYAAPQLLVQAPGSASTPCAQQHTAQGRSLQPLTAHPAPPPLQHTPPRCPLTSSGCRRCWWET